MSMRLGLSKGDAARAHARRAQSGMTFSEICDTRIIHEENEADPMQALLPARFCAAHTRRS
jgi:hypothetical protein